MGILKFEKIKDITSDAGNTDPLIVGNLCIAEEPLGELVQYYVQEGVAGDKAALVKQGDYDGLQWSLPSRRMTGKPVERIGVKSFPSVGGMAYCKYLDENKSALFIPINAAREYGEAPVLAATKKNGSLKLAIESKTTYDYYRIFLRCGKFAEEHISYKKVFEVPMPGVNGTYSCYAVGYKNEGEESSYESNIVEIEVAGGRDIWNPISPAPSIGLIEQMIREAVGNGGSRGATNLAIKSISQKRVSLESDTVLADQLALDQMIVSSNVNAIRSYTNLEINFDISAEVVDEVSIQLPAHCYKNKNGISNIVNAIVTSGHWFSRGEVNSVTPAGDLEFSAQTGGRNNQSTYSSDGYILLSYQGAASYFLSWIYAQNYIPRNVYGSITVTYTLENYPITTFRPCIGLRKIKSNGDTPDTFSFYGLLVKTSTEKELALDLDGYNTGNTNMYLQIGGGCVGLKIFEIRLE